MKITFFSDTHDNIGNIERAVALAIKEGAEEYLLHCGDICSPATLDRIVDIWRGEIHYCLGNMDATGFIFEAKKDSIHFYREDVAKVKIGGRSIAFQHYPEIALKLAESGVYDAVFYGHSHRRHSEYVGKTLLANPGNVCGVIESPGFAIYETEENSLRHIGI